MALVEGCFTCREQATPPPRDAIWREGGWRVAHSFNASLPGWLVVVPTRHVEALTELTDDEAAVMGPLLRDVSAALEEVTGCLKTYVILLAEAEGFHHLHLHVVPRARDLPEERRGTAVFAYLKEEPLTEAQRDDVAASLTGALRRRRGGGGATRRRDLTCED